MQQIRATSQYFVFCFQNREDPNGWHGWVYVFRPIKFSLNKQIWTGQTWSNMVKQYQPPKTWILPDPKNHQQKRPSMAWPERDSEGFGGLQLLVRRGMRAADARKACPDITLVHVETISEGTEETGTRGTGSVFQDMGQWWAIPKVKWARCLLAKLVDSVLDTPIMYGTMN